MNLSEARAVLLSPLGPVGDTARREQHRVKGQPRRN